MSLRAVAEVLVVAILAVAITRLLGVEGFLAYVVVAVLVGFFGAVATKLSE
jgi:hypothetical protein